MSSKKVPPPPLSGPPPPPQISGLDGFGQELKGIPSEDQIRFGSDAVADYAASLDAAIPQLDELSLDDLSDAPSEDHGPAQMHPAQAAALAEAQAMAAHKKAEREAAAAKAKAAGESGGESVAPVVTAPASPPPTQPAASLEPVDTGRPQQVAPAPAPAPAPSSAFMPPEMVGESALSLDLDRVSEKDRALLAGEGAQLADSAAESGRRQSPATMANAAVAELAGTLEESESLAKPATESRDGVTGAQAVVSLPGQSAADLPNLQLARMGGPSPTPVPQKTGLFSSDLIINGLVAGLIGLLLGLYPGYESSRRIARDEVEPMLVELEESINAPLDVRAGKLREPKKIAREIGEKEGEVRGRYFTFWLGSAVPLGLLLAFLRRRPRS
jgi:hypothetical protein